METEKKHTGTVYYLDPTARPDVIEFFGEPRIDGTTYTFKVGHSNGHDNFLTLYDVKEVKVKK